MKYRHLLLVSLCLFILPLQSLLAKQIAITFDDAPRPDSTLTGKQRTDLLMQALKTAQVPQVMFFVTTKHLTPDTQYQMAQYQKFGHLIANHSQQHAAIHVIGAEKYAEDIVQADKILQQYTNFRPYFRFPFLNEGRDVQSRDAIRAFFKEHDYQNGYVTVDNYDWYMDKLYQDAVKQGLKVDRQKLQRLYVETLTQAIDFYDDIAQKTLGRSPKHVLLLHENDIAAYFIDDLVAHLRQQGWEIISPEEAYQDPIADYVSDTLFNGQGRVAAIAKDQGWKARELVHPAEDEQYLEQLFEQSKVFSKNCTMQDAEKLLGQWQTQPKKPSKAITQEVWHKVSDNTFEGKGLVVKSQTIQSEESLRLVQMQQEIFYLAKVSHNEMPTAFKLVSCKDGLLFENQQHDFPKQIHYKFSDGNMQVEVNDGANKGFELIFYPKTLQ
ncbi:MAG: polysaccharide deacetylase family protein [Kangiellaceae bacterium]|nr:polysaccharide deacetylase family protein [Kangiellaceae bacterium]